MSPRQFMEEEEKKLDQELRSRRENIMDLKKAGHEERLKNA